MNTKQWFKSRTLWFNVITILIGVVQVIAKTYPIPVDVLALIIALGNMILRVISGQPISFGNKVFGFKKK
jgi:hypothetical protein